MQDSGAAKLGLHLKRLREERKLTLSGVESLTAERGERINKTYLFRVERGKTIPTLTRLNLLAQVYRVRLSTLVDLLDEPVEAKRDDDAADVPKDADFEELRSRGIDAERGEDFRRAVGFFRAALDRARREECPERNLRIATVHHDLSIALRKSGRWDLAREEAEDAFELSGVPELLRSKMRFNLAIVYRRLGQARLAMDLLSGLVERKNDLPLELQGLVLREMGSQSLTVRPLEALRHYKAAAVISRKLKDHAGVCGLMVNVGLAHIQLGQHALAVELLERALVLARSHGFAYRAALASTVLGKALYMAGEFEKAKRVLQSSNELSRDADYYDLLFTNHYYLWKMALQASDTAAAASSQRSLKFYSVRLHEPVEELVAYKKERR